MITKIRTICLVGVMACFSAFALAQDASPCDQKFGSDSAETARNLSMFNQYYQQKDYVSAYPYWKYLFDNAPCIQKRVTYTGPYIIKKKMRDVKKTEGDSVYKARVPGLIDTVFMVYDKRIELFGQEGYVLARKAEDITKLTPKNRLEGLELFKKSIEMEGNKTKYDVPKDFMYAAVKQNKRDSASYGIEQMLEVLDIVTPIIDYNIDALNAKGTLSVKDSALLLKWVDTRESVTKMALPYLNCDKITAMKQPKYEENKDNVAWLKSTLKLLDRGGCDNKDFYLMVSEKLFGIEPTPEAALSLAKAFNRKGEDAKAQSYYLKAADLATDDNTKFDIYLKLAKSSKNDRNYADVRKYARMALAINPNSGEAYMLIGDAYKLSAGSCGGGKLGAAGVYLVAADKYAKAKDVDASVAAEAQSKLNEMAARFPDKETAFFQGISEGDSYSIGCWIGESTRVRVRG